MALLIISLIFGSIIIIIGVLSNKYPTIIAGYDKLDERRKKKFPGILQNASLITGLVIIVGSFISYFLNWTPGYLIFLLLPTPIMLAYVLLKGNK